jgi:formate--tetrahydrofolate ligase
VIVATIRALKMHGGVGRDDLGRENLDAVRKGLVNLGRHVTNVRKFGVPAVVAINEFSSDTEAEQALVRDYCRDKFGIEAIVCSHWADGSAGTEALAEHVVNLLDGRPALDGRGFRHLYPDEMPLWDKMRTIATEIYGAEDIIADKRVRAQFHDFQDGGFGHFPICVAKTQYSFSTDPNLKGAPSGHVVPIREVRLSGGAEFLVVICGEIMTMPGLPRVPAAHSIRLDEDGLTQGLF